jgi:hypothetical protein
VAKAPYASIRDLGERCAPGKVTAARKLAVGELPRDCGKTTVAYALWRDNALRDLPPGDPPQVKPAGKQQALAI